MKKNKISRLNEVVHSSSTAYPDSVHSRTCGQLQPVSGPNQLVPNDVQHKSKLLHKRDAKWLAECWELMIGNFMQKIITAVFVCLYVDPDTSR